MHCFHRIASVIFSLVAALVLSACAAIATVPPPSPTTTPETPTPTLISIAARAAATASLTTPTIEPSPTSIELPSPIPTDTTAPTVTPPRGISVELGGCATIWEPGYYKLRNDIKTPAYDCFVFQTHNVVFDCDNHLIEGNDFKGYALFVKEFGFPFMQKPANIEIKNCRVSRHRNGIFVNGGSNVYIHHNTLSGNLDDVNKQRFGIFLGKTEGGGLRLDNVKGAIVEANTTNNQAIGIDVRDSANVTVRNNTMSGNSAWGVHFQNTVNSQIAGNTIRDNIRYCVWGNGTIGRGCDAGGIMLEDGSSYNLVMENIVAGENGNGIFIKAHGSRCGNYNEIRNNRIVDAVYNAIEFSFCEGNQVIGNEIVGSYDAIWFGFSNRTEIRGNRIRTMQNHGIISYNSRNSIVADNWIENSREGIYFYWEGWDAKSFYFLTPTPDRYASRDNRITRNTLLGNSVAGIHLANSIYNIVQDNSFSANGRNIWVEGKDDGNHIDNR